MHNDNLGKFGLGILLQKNNGGVKTEFQSANDGIPDEIIIMNLKAYLQYLEKTFFDRFNAVNK